MTRFDGDGFRGKRQNIERCGECSKIKQTNSRRGGWGEPSSSVVPVLGRVFELEGAGLSE